jgi:hypothetical protein
MNERIRQLAHEAGLPTYNPEGIPTKLEKFAELIVLECMDVADHSNVTGKSIVGQRIKQHFGVESNYPRGK